MPRLSKAKIADLHTARNMAKRRALNPPDEPWIPENQAHWADELRVLEYKLKDAGERLRISKIKITQKPKTKKQSTVQKGKKRNGKTTRKAQSTKAAAKPNRRHR